MVILRNGKNTRYNELVVKRLTKDLVYYTNQIVRTNTSVMKAKDNLREAKENARKATNQLAFYEHGCYIAEESLAYYEDSLAYYQKKANNISQLLEEQRLGSLDTKMCGISSTSKVQEEKLTFQASVERSIALDQQIRQQLPPAVVQPTIYDDLLKSANAATLLKQADYVTDLAKMDENKAEADYLFNLADDLKAESAAITKKLDEKEEAEKAKAFASVSLYRAPCVDLVVEEQNQKKDTTTSASDFRARLNALLDLNQQITEQEQLVTYSEHLF